MPTSMARSDAPAGALVGNGRHLAKGELADEAIFPRSEIQADVDVRVFNLPPSWATMR